MLRAITDDCAAVEAKDEFMIAKADESVMVCP
jgi:hypothetical protein